MYNIDFEAQLRKSREYLFWPGLVNPREMSDARYKEYFPPANLKVIDCKEDANGEWVPSPLEKTVKKETKK